MEEVRKVRIFLYIGSVASDLLDKGSSTSENHNGRIGGNHFGRFLPLFIYMW